MKCFHIFGKSITSKSLVNSASPLSVAVTSTNSQLLLIHKCVTGSLLSNYIQNNLQCVMGGGAKSEVHHLPTFSNGNALGYHQQNYMQDFQIWDDWPQNLIFLGQCHLKRVNSNEMLRNSQNVGGGGIGPYAFYQRAKIEKCV